VYPSARNRSSSTSCVQRKSAKRKFAEDNKFAEGKSAEGKSAEGTSAEGKSAEGKSAEDTSAAGRMTVASSARRPVVKGEGTGCRVQGRLPVVKGDR